MAIHLLLVDGLNLVRRVHAGQAGSGDASESTVAACVASLVRALRETTPSHAACAFDAPGPTWRHDELPTYKAGRKPMPESLRALLPAIRDGFLAAGVSSVERPHTEADDLIATLACKVAAHGGQATVLSTDRAFLSLLGDRIRVRDHFARRDLSRGDVERRFGVPPERLPDLWALAGFTGSGIGGVPGIGPRTAQALVTAHGDLATLLEAARTIPGKAGRALIEHASLARRSLALVRLRTDLEIGVNLHQLRLRSPAPSSAVSGRRRSP